MPLGNDGFSPVKLPQSPGIRVSLSSEPSWTALSSCISGRVSPLSYQSAYHPSTIDSAAVSSALPSEALYAWDILDEGKLRDSSL